MCIRDSPYFHIEHRPKFKPNPFDSDHFPYNEKADCLVCPMGQFMVRTGTRDRKTESGYVTEAALYTAQGCAGCPLHKKCFRGEGDRTVRRNHRLKAYKEKAAKLLTSEEGIKHRGRRCIEPEAVFGQMKQDMMYKRFRHFGKDKVEMDFAFFAIAFNIQKMCRKTA